MCVISSSKLGNEPVNVSSWGQVVRPSLEGERGKEQAAMLMTSAAIYPGEVLICHVFHSSPVRDCCRSDRMWVLSCLLASGASGGAVIGLDGCMIGLVTSNARDSNANRSLPKLNFSIPASALQPLWQLLHTKVPITTPDFVKLDVSSEVMSSVWALHPDLASDKELPGRAQRLQKLLEDKGILPAGLPRPSGSKVIQSRL